MPPQNSKCHKHDMKKVPQQGPTNIRHHHTKFSHPQIVHPILKASVRIADPIILLSSGVWHHFSKADQHQCSGGNCCSLLQGKNTP